MAIQHYKGSCQCGAVAFEADLDLDNCLEGVGPRALPSKHIDGRAFLSKLPGVDLSDCGPLVRPWER